MEIFLNIYTTTNRTVSPARKPQLAPPPVPTKNGVQTNGILEEKVKDVQSLANDKNHPIRNSCEAGPIAYDKNQPIRNPCEVVPMANDKNQPIRSISESGPSQNGSVLTDEGSKAVKKHSPVANGGFKKPLSPPAPGATGQMKRSISGGTQGTKVRLK